ncbi:MAG: diguanylate cyclase [Cyanobacteria bacterium P01_H01_bin.162]
MLRMRKSKIIWLTVAGVLYYLTAIAGMQVFSLQPQNIALLWLPIGIGLIMCLQMGWQACPYIFVASFAANFPGMSTNSLMASVGHNGIAAITDAFTPLFAAWVLQQKMPGKLLRARELLPFCIYVLPFCIYVCLLPTTVSASILATNLAMGGYIAWSQSPNITGHLILADSLGILLIYPIFASWKSRAIALEKILTTVLATSFSLALVTAAFRGIPSAIYLVVPVLLYLASVGYKLGHSIMLLLTVVVILAFAADGFGPFAIADVEHSLTMLMTFVFSITLVSQSVMLYREELIESIEARELWYQRSIRDSLTGLYNRAYFLSRLNDELARSQRSQQPFVLAMVDVDFFKQINDQYGHPFGDQVLQSLAAMMRQCLRSADVIARIGGEEFAVLMPDVALIQATAALERLRLKLAADGCHINGQHFDLTVSMGASENGAQSIETLISTTDELL